MSTTERTRFRSPVWPLLLMGASFFLWAADWTFDPGDWPSPYQYPHPQPVGNACGKSGAFVAYHLRSLLGDGVYPVLLFGTFASAVWLVRGSVAQIPQRMFGLVLLVAATAASTYLLFGREDQLLEYGFGGLVGAALGTFLTDTFSGLGTFFVLAYTLVAGLLFTAEGWVLRFPGAMKRVALASGEAFEAVRRRLPVPAAAGVGGPGMTLGEAVVPDASVVIPPARALRRDPGDAGRIDAGSSPVATSPVASKDLPQEDSFSVVPSEGQVLRIVRRESTEPAKQGEREAFEASSAAQEAELEAAASEREAPSIPSEAPVAVEIPDTPPPLAEAYPRRLASWRCPPLSLLDDPEYRFTAAQESQLRAKAKTLERTLAEFRLDARVVEIDTGPVITMFELELAAGVKVSQVAALANDIARALRAHAVRIVAPIPGKTTVGVEVPNTDKEKVRLKGLALAMGKGLDEAAIPLLLGKDASGKALVPDLASMPHLLIAGTTGSGKSVSINAIIMSILMFRRPDMVKLILIDPKMVEMSQFKDVPHLMSPIITDTQRAEEVLDWAVTKMEERYALIAEARVRNIAGFNQLGAEEVYRRFQPANELEKKQIPTHLPYIVIIIDELADLMMTSAKQVEHHLSRLAQKSRAVGIHIVVATQRPEVKVVTGLIKSNLPCRCAFRVASRMDSRIVLDQNGAEVLMGQGDMLFLPPGAHKLVRAQGTYVEDHELTGVIDFLCDQGRAEYHPELQRLRAKDAVAAGLRDPLFDEAVKVILETKRGSVSLLQRRLNIGYSRAARLIDQMAEAGIVGDYKGSQAREVVVTADEWAAIQKEVAADMFTEESVSTAVLADPAETPPDTDDLAGDRRASAELTIPAVLGVDDPTTARTTPAVLEPLDAEAEDDDFPWYDEDDDEEEEEEEEEEEDDEFDDEDEDEEEEEEEEEDDEDDDWEEEEGPVEREDALTGQPTSQSSPDGEPSALSSPSVYPEATPRDPRSTA